MLAAAARIVGAHPHLLEVAPDDADVLRRRLRRAAEHDVVVTIGGASMGEADLVKRVLDELGYVASFWRVRMRPGTPFGFGWLPWEGRRVPVFGLPGNPSSAFVTFELFVRPALLRMAGHERVLRRSIRCRTGADLPGGRGKAVFVRVLLEPGHAAPAAVPSGPQSSGLVRPLGTAEGLALVPEDRDGIPAGEEVEVLLLDDAPGSCPWVGTEAG
jgi:molybdopterin molybdotransferase